MSDELSFGLAGSDALEELGYEGLISVNLFAIDSLRFALATSIEKYESARDKIRTGETLVIGTSYPNIAKQELGTTIAISPRGIQKGCIEALPEQYSEIDAIFELVRSGDSLRDNGLVILEDNIKTVNLRLVRKNNNEE